MDWMFLSPQNSYAEALTLMWLYLEIMPLEKLLRINEVINLRPRFNIISVFIRDTRELVVSFTLCTHTPRKSHIKIRQDGRLQARKRALIRNWIGCTLIINSQSPELWGNIFLCFSHQVYSILLWQHRQIQVVPKQREESVDWVRIVGYLT